MIIRGKFLCFSYETKGVQWMKSRSNLPPGLNFVEDEKPKDGAVLSKSAKKKLKQKEKKKQAAATSEVQELTNSVKSISLSASGAENEATSSKGQCSQGASQEDAQVVDPEKKLKNLKKKLRQIEGLEAKINSGELKNPETAQLEKVAKKQEVIDAIEDLELELADI